LNEAGFVEGVERRSTGRCLKEKRPKEEKDTHRIRTERNHTAKRKKEAKATSYEEGLDQNHHLDLDLD
jgi:hypothetical protein